MRSLRRGLELGDKMADEVFEARVEANRTAGRKILSIRGE
jgi:hypothetical protein